MKTFNRTLSIAFTALAVTACGSGGSGGSDTPNQKPFVQFTSSCTSERVCTFTSTSSDTDGTISSLQWTFPDGTTATTPEAIFTFADYGRHLVTLQATDNDGGVNAQGNYIDVWVDIHSNQVELDLNSNTIIFQQDFNHRPNGSYTGADLEDDFCQQATANRGGCGITNTELMKSVEIENGALELVYFTADEMPGQPSSFGTSFLINGEYQKLHQTFDITFTDDFFFEGDTKFMGLGGRAPTHGLAPSGCIDVGVDEGWSFRNIAKRNGLVQYIYHQDKTVPCGTGANDYIYYHNERFGFKHDITYTVEINVTMNHPYTNDAVIETWVNGILIKRQGGFNFSDSGEIGINEMIINFYSGVDEMPNNGKMIVDNVFLSTESIVY